MASSFLVALILSATAPEATCSAAVGPLFEGTAIEGLEGQVDGNLIAGPDALIELRRLRGKALLVIHSGSFSGADLSGARLHNICFVGTDLSGSDWTKAKAEGVGFIGANLEGARLRSADLRQALFRNANLGQVDAEGANLAGGRLDGGWFEGRVEGLRLDGANLSHFEFSCGITLDDGCPVFQSGPAMSLKGALLTEATLWGEFDPQGARIDRTEVALADIGRLAHARLEGPVRIRGGDQKVEFTADEFLRLLIYLADPSAAQTQPAFGPAPPNRPPAYARPGHHAFFVDGERHFDPSVQDDELYPKLLPVIIGGSQSRVATRFGSDGTLDAVGDSIGANAHSCSLSGSGLRFDPGSGFYSGPQAASAQDPPEWRGRPIAVLRLDGDVARVLPDSIMSRAQGSGDPRVSDYASCGARAAFVPMVRLPISEMEARRWFETLAGQVN